MRKSEALLLLLPSFLFLGLFTASLALMGLVSVYPYVPPPKFWGTTFTLENYLSILEDRFALFTVGNTLLIGLESTLVSVLFAYPIAQMMVRPGRRWLGKLLSSFVILLLFLNSAVRAVTWMTVLGSSGLINNVLIWLGVLQHPSSLLFTNLAVVLGIVSYDMPFAILMLASSLRYVGVDLEDAARTLGANEFQIFRYVTLPLGELAIIATGTLMFIISLTTFTTPAVLGGGVIPYVTLSIYDTATSVLNLPSASAFSVLFTIMTLSIIFIFGRITGRLLSTGVKRGI
ncbi:MAG TPA: ABC transporter permease [Candidatus Bathyarchaeia archaeon]|nr:ABC transporter permease [Candidatus Bathyarchaeia archaeon]